MGMILLIGVISGAIGLFIVLSQRNNSQQQLAVPSLAAGGIILVSFLSLPWLSITGIPGIVGGLFGWKLPQQLRDAIGNPELVAQIESILQSTQGMTGLRLATDIPTISDGVRVVLFSVPVVACMVLLGGSLFLAGNTAVQKFGLVQAAMCLAVVIMLVITSGSIRSFGLNVSIIGSALSFLSLSLGSGWWITVLGMLLGGASGIILSRTSTSLNSKKRSRKSLPKKR